MKALVLASSALSYSCEETLKNLDFEPIRMPPYKRLQDGVSTHPDMLVFFMGDKYFCTTEYYNEAKQIFERINALGYSPVLCNEIPSATYPNDIIFNALPLGKLVFGLENSLSSTLKSEVLLEGKKIVNVKQGYTKCSVAKISESAIITSDKGIAKAASQYEIDALTVCEGHVLLDGYSTGFIGGACGTFEDKVYFCGNLRGHPDCDKIEDFCKKHKKSCISLSNEPLFDVGSLFFLPKV